MISINPSKRAMENKPNMANITFALCPESWNVILEGIRGNARSLILTLHDTMLYLSVVEFRNMKIFPKWFKYKINSWYMYVQVLLTWWILPNDDQVSNTCGSFYNQNDVHLEHTWNMYRIHCSGHSNSMIRNFHTKLLRN